MDETSSDKDSSEKFLKLILLHSINHKIIIQFRCCRQFNIKSKDLIYR